MFNIFYKYLAWRNSDKFSSKSEQNSMKMIKFCKIMPKNAKKIDDIFLKY